MEPRIFIAICFFSVGIIFYLIAMGAWYVSSQNKKRVAQKDFNCLNSNDKNILDSIASLSADIEDELEIIKYDLLEIKVKLNLPVLREFKNKD